MPSLNTVIKQASRGADLYFVFRFLRLLTMKYEKTDAFKYGIIDKKGNPLKRSSDLETVDEKAAYTMLHRLVFKVRRLIEKVHVACVCMHTCVCMCVCVACVCARVYTV